MTEGLHHSELALKLLNDQTLIAKVARNAKNIYRQQQAIEKMTDRAILNDFAQDENFEQTLRNTAKKRALKLG